MTQTIKKCNEIPEGKIYLVGDLRTAPDLETLCAYVDAGHPIAWIDGGTTKHLQRHEAESFNCYRALKVGWQHQTVREDTLTHFVKLAPLAYRNGRPLHFGGDIEVRILGNKYDIMTMSIDLITDLPTMQWHFADESEAL